MLDHDPDKNWRRIWQILHSPGVLLPTVVIGLVFTVADLPEAMIKRGWLLGPLIGVATMIGILITAFEVIPRLMKWLLDLHALLDRGIDVLGQRLKSLNERINRVFSDSATED
jgi:hypothetical protein